LRPKLVYESHGFSPVFSGTMQELVSGAKPGSSRKLQRLTRREQRVWEGADGYVTTTGVLARELRERFGERRLVTTIPNGVRLPAGRALDPSARPGADRGQNPRSAAENSLVIGYAGHLYPWKGVDVLIRALEQLPDARALIVGGFPTESDLDRARLLARQLKVEHRIEFTGQVEPARVPALLAETDILVLPTVATASAIYTSPLKLFEYFAAGRPIVASDLPPVREIVRDGENGLLFEAGSPESLAAAIRRVQEDTHLAERLARTAFGEADKYGWSRRAERLEAFLVSVMQDPPPTPRPARTPKATPNRGFHLFLI
jgi:glycosyltransferase involved in cell wall biosynthesis